MPLRKSILLLLAAALAVLADAQTTAQGFSIYSKRITSDNGLPCDFIHSTVKNKKESITSPTQRGSESVREARFDTLNHQTIFPWQ